MTFPLVQFIDNNMANRTDKPKMASTLMAKKMASNIHELLKMGIKSYKVPIYQSIAQNSSSIKYPFQDKEHLIVLCTSYCLEAQHLEGFMNSVSTHLSCDSKEGLGWHQQQKQRRGKGAFNFSRRWQFGLGGFTLRLKRTVQEEKLSTQREIETQSNRNRNEERSGQRRRSVVIQIVDGSQVSPFRERSKEDQGQSLAKHPFSGDGRFFICNVW